MRIAQFFKPAAGGPSTSSTSGIATLVSRVSQSVPRSGWSCHNSPMSWPLNV